MGKREELVEFLSKHKIPQQDFADTVGVTMPAVNHWVNGIRKIPETVIRLVRFFDENPEDMYYFKQFASADKEDESDQ